jgi:hypothetical protein
MYLKQMANVLNPSLSDNARIDDNMNLSYCDRCYVVYHVHVNLSCLLLIQTAVLLCYEDSNAVGYKVITNMYASKS